MERYLASFNETDARSPAAVARWALRDRGAPTPIRTSDLCGPEQIDGFVAQTQERFPGFTFTLGGPVDAHHNQARFQWHAGPADSPDQFVGFDVIVTDGDRIRNVYGFMDAAPAA